jgi:hypothetical protein
MPIRKIHTIRIIFTCMGTTTFFSCRCSMHCA